MANVFLSDVLCHGGDFRSSELQGQNHPFACFDCQNFVASLPVPQRGWCNGSCNITNPVTLTITQCVI